MGACDFSAISDTLLIAFHSRSVSQTDVAPKIARIWRGRTTKAKADDYHAYLAEGIKTLGLRALGVQMLREDRATESEFVVISYWESFEAMSRYSGSDPSKIRHLPRDAELLIELPERVHVLEIVSSAGNVGGGTD